MTVGLSSASFCPIASALRHSASASADLPITGSRLLRLLWLFARRLRNWVSAGLSSASFSWIAIAFRYSASASAKFRVPASELPRMMWLLPACCGIG